MTRAILILGLIMGLAACETIKGAGKDMQKAGATVQSEAAQTQANM